MVQLSYGMPIPCTSDIFVKHKHRKSEWRNLNSAAPFFVLYSMYADV